MTIGQARPRYVRTALFVLLVANLVLFLDSVRRALLYRVEFTYGEGITLYLAQYPSLMYEPLAEAPYIITFYTPVYIYITNFLNVFSNDIFLSGRGVTIVASLIVASLIALIVRSLRSESRIAPILAGALFIFNPIVARKYAVYARVDMLGLAFAVAAIYWFVTRTGHHRVTGSVVFCLLAVLTKQSFIAAPVAILLTLIWERNWREVTLFSLGGGMIASLAALAFVLMTDGQAITHLVVYNQAAGFFLEWGAKQYFRLLGIFFPLFGIVGLVRPWRRDDIPPVIIFYTLAGVLVGSVLLFRRGAGLNHALEFIIGVTVIVGLILDEETISADRTRNQTSELDPIATGIALLVVIQLGSYGFLGAFVAVAHSPAPGEVSTASAISDAEKPVISSDLGVIVRANVRTDMNDPEYIHYLRDRGLWDSRQFVSRLKKDRYSYIVTSFDIDRPPKNTFWSEAELKAMRSEYRLASYHGNYRIYVPEDD